MLKHQSSRHFQPEDGPSRGLLRDCTTSPINRFAALAETVPEDAASTTDDLSSLQTEEEEVPDTEPVEADTEDAMEEGAAEEDAEAPAPEENNVEADEEMEDMD